MIWLLFIRWFEQVFNRKRKAATKKPEVSSASTSTVGVPIFFSNQQASTVNEKPITTTYTPPELDNGQSVEQDVMLNGVKVSNHYNLQITTAIDGFHATNIQLSVVADDLVRIYIVNETGETLRLPTMTISALKLY